MRRIFQGFVVSLAVFLMVWVGGSVPASRASSLEVRHFDGTAYVTGGMGLDERSALEEAAREYNLKLSCAMTGGKYVADVRVVIRDASGRTVLDAATDGPWLFAKLPAGSYRIFATFGGVTHQRTVELSGSRQTVVNLFWRGSE